MIEPKIDEYWYYKDIWGPIEIVKVFQINGDDYWLRTFLYGIHRATKGRFIKKWEPNWFWRLLGYR